MQYDEHTREWYTRHEFFRSGKPLTETLGISQDAPIPAGECGEHNLD